MATCPWHFRLLLLDIAIGGVEGVARFSSSRTLPTSQSWWRAAASKILPDSAGGTSIFLDQRDIPKIIHSTSTTDQDVNASAQVLLNASETSFRQLFPSVNFTFMLHSDSDMEQCVQEEFPHFMEEYGQLSRDVEALGGPSEKENVGRYCAIWKYGGIYADPYYEAIKNFYDELPSGKVSLLASPYVENANASMQVETALMASPPRHPFWQEVFQQMSARGDSGERSSTGPALISMVASRNTDAVNMLPCMHVQQVGSCLKESDFDQMYGIHWDLNAHLDSEEAPSSNKLRMGDEWSHFHPEVPFPFALPESSQPESSQVPS